MSAVKDYAKEYIEIGQDEMPVSVALLVLKYRYETDIRKLSDDIEKVKSRQLALSDLFMSGTTNPNKPFKKGDFVVTVDGFIVSANVEVTYSNVIETGFKYSDHNPVWMKFKLK